MLKLIEWQADDHVLLRARAIWAWQGNEFRDLTLKEGDIIDVFSRFHEHWWFGRSHDRVGIFPCTYVTTVCILLLAFNLSKTSIGARPSCQLFPEAFTTSMVPLLRRGAILYEPQRRYRAASNPWRYYHCRVHVSGSVVEGMDDGWEVGMVPKYFRPAPAGQEGTVRH